MGGFKLACTKEEGREVLMYKYQYQSRLGDDIWEGVLQSWDFRKLLEGHKIDFPSTSEAEIDDRSKGDALSKGIALLQITWFIIQLIARRVQGLTITELELTTAVLAGLNSVMYVFWWNKPLDVRCPIIIRTKAVERMLAERPVEEHEWKFVLSSARSLCQTVWALVDLLFHSLLTFLAWCLCAIRRSSTKLIYDSTPDPEQLNNGSSSDASIGKNKTSELGRRDNNVGASVEEKEKITRAASEPSPVAEPMSNNENNTGVKLYNRMKEVTRAVLAFAKNATGKLILIPRIIMFMPFDEILHPASAAFLIEEYKDSREKIHNKSSLKLLFNEWDIDWIMSMIFFCDDTDAKPLLYFSAVAGAAFGSIHCAAWNFDFPSHFERKIGRAHV